MVRHVPAGRVQPVPAVGGMGVAPVSVAWNWPSGTPGGVGMSGGGQASAASRFFLPVPAASTVQRLIVPATKTP